MKKPRNLYWLQNSLYVVTKLFACVFSSVSMRWGQRESMGYGKGDGMMVRTRT